MRSHRLLILILALTVIATVIDLPASLPLKFTYGPLHLDTTLTRPVINFTFGGHTFQKDFNLKQGLDLQGGTHVVLQTDMSQIAAADQADALESARGIIARRVYLFGVAEPLIQTAQVGDDYRLVSELAVITNINQALDIIGQTAQLDFRELPPEATDAASLDQFILTGLTGKNLKKASVQYGQTGAPEVTISFDETCQQLFGDLTSLNVNRPLAIFLDNLPVTIPTVNQAITQGNAVITRQFTLDNAKTLSIQLNAGALPVPIAIVEQKNIGASLGRESVQKSLRAGLIGLEMVMLFMILYYGWLGFLADIALIIYGIITLALYKF